MDSSGATNWTVVLDLDDTLYKEVDYQSSGIDAVSKEVLSLFKVDVSASLLEMRAAGITDLFGELCTLLNLSESVKESLLWIYRLHAPNIELSGSVRSFLRFVECRHNLVILTDGRSITQRIKLKALGLGHLPAYISEEFSSEKPDLLRFEKIMTDYQSRSYVYIGDNPKKDFLAPNHLGWTSIGLRGDSRNVHQFLPEDCPKSYQPKHWIDTLEEALEHLC